METHATDIAPQTPPAISQPTVDIEAPLASPEATTRPPAPTAAPGVDRDAEYRRIRCENIATFACSSILMATATCLLPFAVRAAELDEANDLLVNILAAVFVTGLMGTSFVFCRRHIALRRQAGYDNACFDCLDLRAPANPWNPHSLQHLREVAELPDAQSMRNELRVLTALGSLPERKWEGGERPLECSLCMDEVDVGAAIRQLG